MRTILSLTVWLMFGALHCAAQHWMTLDKRVTITKPDPAVFREVEPPPPPFSVLWVNDDESIKLGVLSMDAPPNAKVNFSAMKEGMQSEAPGAQVDGTEVNKSNHSIYTLTATAKEYVLKQKIYIEKGKAHKVMAMATADANPQAANDFINSVGFNPPEAPKLDTQQVSKYAGSGGVLILIIIAVRRLTRRKSEPST